MPNPQVMVWKFQDQEDHGAVNVEYQNDSTAEPFYSSINSQLTFTDVIW